MPDDTRTVWNCLRCGKPTSGDEGDHECKPEMPDYVAVDAWTRATGKKIRQCPHHIKPRWEQDDNHLIVPAADSAEWTWDCVLGLLAKKDITVELQADFCTMLSWSGLQAAFLAMPPKEGEK